MAKLTNEKFAKLLKSGEASEKREPVYFLHGPEPRRVLDASNALKQALLPALGGDDNYFRYFSAGTGPDEASIGEITAQLNTVSMFGGGKLVWLGPVETLDKTGAAQILEYAKNPNPQSTLILTAAPSKDGGKSFGTFEKSKFTNEIEQYAACVRFASPREGELGKWVVSRLRNRELGIDQGAAELLVDLCDRDLDRLDGEIEKLVSYVQGQDRITIEDVEDSVGDFRAERIWDFTKIFGSREIGQAQAMLAGLMEGGAPAQMLLKMLTTELMRIAAAIDCKERGGAFNTFAQEAGAAPFQVRDAWENSARWNKSQVRAGLRGILKAYMDIMKGQVSQETALNGLLISLFPKPKGSYRG